MRIGEEIQLTGINPSTGVRGYRPNVNACYGPYSSISEASLALENTFGDGGAPVGLTVLINDNGLLKEYWVKDPTDDYQGLVTKTGGSSGSSSSSETVANVYSVTIDGNDIIVLDDDSDSETVASQVTKLRAFNGLTNITPSWESNNIEVKINNKTLEEVDVDDTIPFYVVFDTETANYPYQDNDADDYVQFQLIRKADIDKMTQGIFNIEYRIDLGEVYYSKKQQVVIKNFSGGEIYQLLTTPSTLTKNIDGTLLDSTDNKINVSLLKISRGHYELCDLTETNVTFLVNTRVGDSESTLFTFNTLNPAIGTNSGTSSYGLDLEDDTVFQIFFTDTDVVNSKWFTISAYLTNDLVTDELVDSETINFLRKGERGIQGNPGESGTSPITIELTNDSVILDDDITEANCKVVTSVRASVFQGEDLLTNAKLKVQMDENLRLYFYICTLRDSGGSIAQNTSGFNSTTVSDKIFYLKPKVSPIPEMAGEVSFTYGNITKTQKVSVSDVSNGESYSLLVYPNVVQQNVNTVITAELVKVDKDGYTQSVTLGLDYYILRSPANDQANYTKPVQSTKTLTDTIKITNDAGIVYKACKGVSGQGIEINHPYHGTLQFMYGYWGTSDVGIYKYQTALKVKNASEVVGYIPVFAESRVVPEINDTQAVQTLADFYVDYSSGYITDGSTIISNMVLALSHNSNNESQMDMYAYEYGDLLESNYGSDTLTNITIIQSVLDVETVGVAIKGEAADAGVNIVFDRDSALIIDDDTTLANLQACTFEASLYYNGTLISASTPTYSLSFNDTSGQDASDIFDIQTSGNVGNLTINTGKSLGVGQGVITASFTYDGNTYSKSLQFLVQNFNSGETYNLSVTPNHIDYDSNNDSYLGSNAYVISASVNTGSSILPFENSETLYLAEAYFDSNNVMQVTKLTSVSSGQVTISNSDIKNKFSTNGNLGYGIYSTVLGAFVIYDEIDVIKSGTSSFILSFDNDSVILDDNVDNANIKTASTTGVKLYQGNEEISSANFTISIDTHDDGGTKQLTYEVNSNNSKEFWIKAKTGVTTLNHTTDYFTVSATYKGSIVATKKFSYTVKDLTPDGILYQLALTNDVWSYSASGTGNNITSVVKVNKIVNGEPISQSFKMLKSLNNTSGLVIVTSLNPTQSLSSYSSASINQTTYSAAGYNIQLYYNKILVDSETISCTKEPEQPSINYTTLANSISSKNYVYKGEYDSNKTYSITGTGIKQIPYVSVTTRTLPVVSDFDTNSDYTVTHTTVYYCLNDQYEGQTIPNPTASGAAYGETDTIGNAKAWIRMALNESSVTIYKDILALYVRANQVATNQLLVYDTNEALIGGMTGLNSNLGNGAIISWAGNTASNGNSNIDKAPFRVYKNGKVVCNSLQSNGLTISAPSGTPEYWTTLICPNVTWLNGEWVYGDYPTGTTWNCLRPDTLGKYMITNTTTNIHLPSFAYFYNGVDYLIHCPGYKSWNFGNSEESFTNKSELLKWMAFCRLVVGNKITILGINGDSDSTDHKWLGIILGFNTAKEVTDIRYNNPAFEINSEGLTVQDDADYTLKSIIHTGLYEKVLIELTCTHYISSDCEAVYWKIDNFHTLTTANEDALLDGFSDLFYYNIQNQDLIQSIFNTNNVVA